MTRQDIEVLEETLGFLKRLNEGRNYYQPELERIIKKYKQQVNEKKNAVSKQIE